jgi:predicted lipid-binding transport protein (Tim44 family)
MMWPEAVPLGFPHEMLGLLERATGRVVSGDRAVSQEVTEVWTFRRDHRDPAPGWQLSAIQQV